MKVTLVMILSDLNDEKLLNELNFDYMIFGDLNDEKLLDKSCFDRDIDLDVSFKICNRYFMMLPVIFDG